MKLRVQVVPVIFCWMVVFPYILLYYSLFVDFLIDKILANWSNFHSKCPETSFLPLPNHMWLLLLCIWHPLPSSLPPLPPPKGGPHHSCPTTRKQLSHYCTCPITWNWCCHVYGTPTPAFPLTAPAQPHAADAHVYGLVIMYWSQFS